MNTMTARDLRDAGTSKPQSLNASSTPTERTITSYRTEEPVSDDVSLDLDDTDDPVARTLDYEGLHASFPSSLPRYIYVAQVATPSICPEL